MSKSRYKDVRSRTYWSLKKSMAEWLMGSLPDVQQQRKKPVSDEAFSLSIKRLVIQGCDSVIYLFTQYQTRCKSPSNLQWCIIMLKASCLISFLPVFLGIWSNCFLILQLETKLFLLICWTWNTLIVSYWLSMHMVCHLGHSKLTSCFFPITLFQEGHLS